MPATPEQRLSLITLAVDDLARSRAFYEGLGWQAGFSNDEVAFFQLPGLVFGLWQKAAMAQELGLAPTALGPGGMEVAHNVRRREDVDAFLSAAAEAGGAVLKHAQETPWGGYSGHCTDPDGYRIEVAWNPDWTIEENGATRMGPADPA